MHFVKKLPTTEEQRAVRERERVVRLNIYCGARDKIFGKRSRGELDEEMLALTATQLEKNPDIYTYWNIRREALKFLSKKLPAESDEEYAERADSLFRGELVFTEACLKSNCKSYGAWFHRLWTLKRMSKPDFAQELAACEKFLQIDERNFHCWDYRREVARLSDQSSEDELKFSDRLINTNFSNYSSWHYRSSIMPKLFPDPENQLMMERQALNNEFEKLENAFFTDPEDQSAWIYAEWLLLSDATKKKYDINDVHVLGLTFDFISKRSFSATFVSISFVRAVKFSRIADFLTMKLESGEQWDFATITDLKKGGTSNSYRFQIDAVVAECQLRPSLNEPYQEVDVVRGYANIDEIYHLYQIEQKPVSEERQQMIEQLVVKCREVLNELRVEEREGVEKWPLFTLTLALMELNPIEKHGTILENLNRLAVSVDPRRGGMYQDMVMNLRINERLREKIGDMPMIDMLFKPVVGHAIGELKLDGMGLRSIEHLKYLSPFITRLDLTGNLFTSLHQFKSFRRLTNLQLDRNPIASLKGIGLLPPLDFLSLVGTSFENIELDGKDKSARENVKQFRC